MLSQVKKERVTLSQDQSDAAFQDGVAMYEKAAFSAACLSDVVAAGDFSNPFGTAPSSEPMVAGTVETIEYQQRLYWNHGWVSALSKAQAQASEQPVATTPTIQAAIDEIVEDLITQNVLVKKSHAAWTNAKEQLAIAKKLYDDEQRKLSELVDSLDEAKSGQLRLPFEDDSDPHPDVEAGNNRPHGQPLMEAAAAEVAEHGLPETMESPPVVDLKDIRCVVGGKKVGLTTAILKKLFLQECHTVDDLRAYRSQVTLWLENLQLTGKQPAILAAVMGEYDRLHPESSTPAPAPTKAEPDPNVDESGMFVAGYDKPDLSLAFSEESQWFGRVTTILCADGMIRAAWDVGENENLEEFPCNSFTPRCTSPGFVSRPFAVIDACESIIAILQPGTTTIDHHRLLDLEAQIEHIRSEFTDNETPVGE